MSQHDSFADRVAGFAVEVAHVSTSMRRFRLEAILRQARHEAELAMPSIVQAVEAAIIEVELCGKSADSFRCAIEKLNAQTDPLAMGNAAAQAHGLLYQVLLTWPNDTVIYRAAEIAVKKAERNVRSLVVMLIRGRCEDRMNKRAFELQLRDAFGVDELDKELRAKLLLAYYKDELDERGFSAVRRALDSMQLSIAEFLNTDGQQRRWLRHEAQARGFISRHAILFGHAASSHASLRSRYR